MMRSDVGGVEMMVEIENIGRSKGHVALKSMPMQTIDDVLL